MVKPKIEFLCSVCRVRLKAVPETEGELWRCPSCSVSETHEHIIQQAKARAAEIAASPPKPG